MSPAVEKIDGKGRVLVFSYGVADSGIPPSWAVSNKKSGVNYLKDLSSQNLNVVKNNLMQYARPDDIIVLTIHWGGNWGYEIPSNQVSFAHKLIDEAGVDVIHGHSSHHVKGIEVYRGKLILYGSGDFLNDYEGIGGHEQFRGDLSLMYFASIEQGTGKLLQLQMIPTQIKHFRVNQASNTDTLWLRNLLNREGRKLGTQVSLNQTSELILEWR
jgi:poly-gamma-glutamate synthesis protein (capsule biosynthesis protein)